MIVKPVEGNLVKMTLDVIIAPTNNSGAFFGRIDDAIRGVAGEQYHEQLLNLMTTPVMPGVKAIFPKEVTGINTYYIKKAESHIGGFDDILFIVDNQSDDLSEVIYTALNAINEEALLSNKTVKAGIPLLRQGFFAAFNKLSNEEYVNAYIKGVKKFTNSIKEYNGKSNISELRIVVYHNDELMSAFSNAFQGLSF